MSKVLFGRERIALLVAGYSLIFSAPLAQADDSTAAIGVGGIEFTKNSSIVMEDEDLYISKDIVHIRFKFDNIGRKDIKEIVAFPMPDLEMGNLSHSDVPLPAEEVNFLRFSVSVDGIAVKPNAERKAYVDDYKWTGRGLAAKREFLKRTDVTDLLGDVLSEKSPNKMANDYKFSKTVVGEAKSRGVDIEDGDSSPAWTLATKFYWTQKFPAGRSVIIEHSYHPIVGNYQGVLWDYDKKAYCPSSSVLRDESYLRKDLDQYQSQGSSNELRYVLTTGANWAGPIRHFKLTIDTENPDLYLASCFPGLRKTSPDEYGIERRNYTPTQDIDVVLGPRWVDPSGPFLIPTSDSKLIDASDLETHTAEFLRVARDEIYARHGYVFNDSGLQSWFARRSWYHPKPGPVELNKIEKANIAIILKEESQRSSPSAGANSGS